MAKGPKEGNSPVQDKGLSSEARRDALLDAEARESPVLSLIAKRLRTARKKVKRADEIEALREGGKTINPDQEEAIKTRSKNVATIEELERLFPLLKEAVNTELNEKLAQKTTEIEVKAKEGASIEIAEQAKILAEANEIEKSKASALAEDLKLKAEEALADRQLVEEQRLKAQSDHESAIANLQSSSKSERDLAISRLINLFYFSRLFSKEGFANDYVPTTERNACLSYDQSLDSTDEGLTERDLENICAFGKNISSRPPSDIISHERALERCIALALEWVNGGETPVPFINATVSDLVAKFERILSSDYYTVQPLEVAPEVKPAHNQRPSFQPEPVQNARSGALNGHYNPPNTFGSNSTQIPPVQQAQNGNILQHILGPRPGQAPHDRQLPSEAISFLPPLQNSLAQQASGALDGSLHNPAPGGPTFGSQQPPGFEMGGQKAVNPAEASGPAVQFNEHSFQGTRFGGPPIPAPSIAQSQPEVRNANTHSQPLAPGQPQPISHHQPSYTPLHDSMPSNSVPPTASTKSTESAIPDAKATPQLDSQVASQASHVKVDFASQQAPSVDSRTSVGGQNGGRQSRGPSDQYRGRGQSRGRGGRGRESVPRGGLVGRGGYNPGRGHRGGRGSREVVPQPAPYATGVY